MSCPDEGRKRNGGEREREVFNEGKCYVQMRAVRERGGGGETDRQTDRQTETEVSSLKVLCPDEGRKTNVREKSVFNEGKCYVQMAYRQDVKEKDLSSGFSTSRLLPVN